MIYSFLILHLESRAGLQEKNFYQQQNGVPFCGNLGTERCVSSIVQSEIQCMFYDKEMKQKTRYEGACPFEHLNTYSNYFPDCFLFLFYHHEAVYLLQDLM